jgi:hypothetical protein
MLRQNKLERLYFASTFSLVYSFRGRQDDSRTYQLKVRQPKALAAPANVRLGWKYIAEGNTLAYFDR